MHDSISQKTGPIRAVEARAPANDQGSREDTATVLDGFSAYATLRATATTRGRQHVVEIVEKQRDLLAWLAREMLVDPDAANVGDVHENTARLKILELLASTVDVQETLQFISSSRDDDRAPTS